MADETTMINGQVSEDRTVNIAGDDSADSEPKVSQLSQKITALEQEKQELVHENEIIKDRIEKLKESVNKSNAENEDLKNEIEKLGSENKAMQSVVGRAAELEAEVSRLQHDLISAMSDLEETNKEASEWKNKVENLENGKTESSVKLDAIKNERDLLIAKLESVEVRELEKEEEIKGLQRKIEQLKFETMEKVEALELKVEEKERMISMLEEKQKEIDGEVNGKTDIVEEDRGSAVVEETGKGNFIGGFEWPVVAVSLVSAVAVAGVITKKRVELGGVGGVGGGEDLNATFTGGNKQKQNKHELATNSPQQNVSEDQIGHSSLSKKKSALLVLLDLQIAVKRCQSTKMLLSQTNSPPNCIKSSACAGSVMPISGAAMDAMTSRHEIGSPSPHLTCHWRKHRRLQLSTSFPPTFLPSSTQLPQDNQELRYFLTLKPFLCIQNITNNILA
ncbi:hypothetical protein M9H77_21372 [Catharanthus roseus]|uniref:Uncharacterized protein n=1 Tax=Catharanthus roseus TaxID=4058 RepID=A0ACC0AMI9_CATRO|nr:hypothetical protein M9H77_21372 [Catharanthus roseus]